MVRPNSKSSHSKLYKSNGEFSVSGVLRPWDRDASGVLRPRRPQGRYHLVPCDTDREAVLRNLKYTHGAGVTREGGRAAGEVLDRVIEDEEEEEQQAKFNDVEDLPALIHNTSAEPEDELESVMPVHVSQDKPGYFAPLAVAKADGAAFDDDELRAIGKGDDDDEDLGNFIAEDNEGTDIYAQMPVLLPDSDEEDDEEEGEESDSEYDILSLSELDSLELE